MINIHNIIIIKRGESTISPMKTDASTKIINKKLVY